MALRNLSKQYKIKRSRSEKRKKMLVNVAALAAVATIATMATVGVYKRAEVLQDDEMANIMAHQRIATYQASKAVVEIAAEETAKKKITLSNVPLAADLQFHIVNLCEENEIDPAIVYAIIWHESRFIPDVMGDNGRSYGLMQVQKKYHIDRMAKLGATDLLDPFDNVTVGIDILKELIDYYDGNVEMALVAYQYGQTGAYKYFFSKGVYCNEFSQEVFDKAGEYDVCA